MQRVFDTGVFDTADLHGLAVRYAKVTAAVYARAQLKGRAAGITRGARHLSLAIRLADPTQLDRALRLAEPLALACRAPACLAERREGMIAYQFQLAERFWATVTRAQVQGATVGLADGGRPVAFDFAEPHALIAGTTGSGKSEAIKSILAGLVTTQSPAELGLLLLDPHRDLEPFSRSAHLVAPIAHDRDGIKDSLLWACREMGRRREANERDGRRLVIVADEGPEALGDERLLSLATETARQCRKFGMSFVIGSQDSKRGALGDLPTVLLNRWIGLCADARASAQLSGHAGLGAHLLTGKGDFWHVVGAKAERLQVALATAADLDAIPRVLDVPDLDVDPADLVPDLEEEERDPGGRPAVVAEPDLVAFYLAHLFGNESVSTRQAAKRGITRTRHEVNKRFAEEVRDHLDRYDAEGLEDLEDES